MSEFKFACPVCGQHITAGTHSSGTQLECPTCFQKIIVPQAPASGDSKFILSAAKKRTARPSATPESVSVPAPAAERRLSVVLVAGLAVAGIVGAALFFLRDSIFPRPQPQAQLVTNAAPQSAPKPLARPGASSIPTNLTWTLDLTNAILPEATAGGSLHGRGFFCEHATLQGGNLGLRQGPRWPPELGLNIQLFATLGEELSGKTVEITPDRVPPLPKVILRWKNEQQKPVSKTISRGYALKVVFGQPANNRMPGKLYIALPDPEKSFVGGSFVAEIRKPPPPKPPQPKPSQPKAPQPPGQ